MSSSTSTAPTSPRSSAADRKIIYRDLKLENVLLYPSNYVILTDMGLAKVVIRMCTVCGTADYFAPADWWLSES